MAKKMRAGRIESKRTTKDIEALYALTVRDEAGKEGVVRRNTPYGPQAWITDDPELVESLLAWIREMHFPDAVIVKFTRA